MSKEEEEEEKQKDTNELVFQEVSRTFNLLKVWFDLNPVGGAKYHTQQRVQSIFSAKRHLVDVVGCCTRNFDAILFGGGLGKQKFASN